MSRSAAAQTPVRPTPAPHIGWRAASHRLGRGRMRADEVRAEGRGFRLRLLPGVCDGAEVRTVSRYHLGRYAMRMRTPRAPGSISAFFLYADVGGGNDEIDIEIFNDTSRVALLTTWMTGEKTHEQKVRLDFDPAAGLHDYAIRWSGSALRFEADGRVLAEMQDRYPTAPMKVMANVWWPVWMDCVPPSAPAELVIESFTLGGTRAKAQHFD